MCIARPHQEADNGDAAETTLEVRRDAFEGQQDSAEQDVKGKLRSILGTENLHFASLIDQLIFMEESS